MQDSEHFRLQVTSDARGQVRFRDGTPWSTPAMIEENGRIKTVTPGIAPEIIGRVGSPDKWPDKHRTVPEEGRWGLEQTLDTILQGTRPGLSGQLQENGLSPVLQRSIDSGDSYHLDPRFGRDVITTISRRDEVQAERMLNHLPVNHASVVSVSLPSHEIRVLASKNHVQSDALTAITPGSVFKIVTEAAALETDLVQTRTMFQCVGLVHLPNVNMRCWKTHGSLTLTEAFVESCDTTFATIGAELGRKPFLVMGKRFGLTSVGTEQVDGRRLLPAADTGVIFKHDGADTGLLANTGIGQEDVRITPLEGALLAATIASEGRYQPGRLIHAITTHQGASAGTSYLSTSHSVKACSRFTADVIGQGMWDVAHQALGTAYRLHDFPVAVKTGTAELQNGHVNAWLIGYRLSHGKPVEAFAFSIADEPSNQAHHHLYQLATEWFHNEAELGHVEP